MTWNADDRRPGIPHVPDNRTWEELERLESELRSADVPEERLLEAVRSGSWDALTAAASPAATARVVTAAASDPEPVSRLSAAASPALPTWTANMLARDESALVRCGLAANEDAPPAALAALSLDSFAPVRVRVARNRSCPPWVAARLVDDDDPGVRREALASPCLPETVACLHAIAGSLQG